MEKVKSHDSRLLEVSSAHINSVTAAEGCNVALVNPGVFRVAHMALDKPLTSVPPFPHLSSGDEITVPFAE